MKKGDPKIKTYCPSCGQDVSLEEIVLWINGLTKGLCPCGRLVDFPDTSIAQIKCHQMKKSQRKGKTNEKT